MYSYKLQSGKKTLSDYVDLFESSLKENHYVHITLKYPFMIGQWTTNTNNLKLLQFKCMTEKTSNKGTFTQSHPLKQIHTIALQVQQLKLLLGTSVSRLIPESLMELIMCP